MKLLALLLLFFSGFTKAPFNDSNKEMEYIRMSYGKAVSDKKLCKTMIETLKNKSENSVNLAYLGAFKTIWAHHAINPISKLSTFNKGKKYIESAVKQNPDNVEIRFVRLSVQKNCPSFLGYNDEIDQDVAFINANKHRIASQQLNKMIAEIIKKELP